MQLNMKTFLVALAATLFTTAAVAQSKAEKADKPAKAAGSGLSVNGVTIPKASFDAMNRERELAGQPATPEIAKAIKEELINREILTQAARKKGLEKDPATAAQMEMARQAVLIRAYFDDYVKANPITDAALKTQYDLFAAQMGDKEYKVRHILVDGEDEAKTIIANLGRGEAFEKLAKEKSKDTGSKDNGGDLDWAPAGRYVPEFANAVKAMQKGETSKTPVKSPYGFHVIRLDDSRPLKVPGFDEAKENLRQRMQQEQVANLVKSLRDRAKIEEK